MLWVELLPLAALAAAAFRPFPRPMSKQTTHDYAGRMLLKLDIYFGCNQVDVATSTFQLLLYKDRVVCTACDATELLDVVMAGTPSVIELLNSSARYGIHSAHGWPSTHASGEQDAGVPVWRPCSGTRNMSAFESS